ncbi:GTP1/OBG domain containing protein [Trema orientale]|uniref:GTP1/OBG domain containing protein n=1 Tax=Trema orientale TaxID=63057 RepID=A0A2P5EJB0_TREOI|nr:GTP1/OBG domain containing protein [Trema orientale]
MLVHFAKPVWYLKLLRKSSETPWSFLFRSSYADSPMKNSKLAPLQERRMIDRLILYAKGGDGGNGCSSFRRSRHERRGKPDGRNGGRGGDVIFECSPAVSDFSSLQHHVNASRGGHGASKNQIGTRGVDKVVQVPIGTIHLIKGEIPYAAENHSSRDLDPWEIPDTLSNGVSVSDLRTAFNDPSMAEDSSCSSFCSETCMEDSAKMEQSARVSSPGLNSQLSASQSCSEEEYGEEQEKKCNVVELTEQGERVIVARGGEGGLGNLSTFKVSKNPKTKDPGFQGDKVFELEVSDDNQSSPSVGSPGSYSRIRTQEHYRCEPCGDAKCCDRHSKTHQGRSRKLGTWTCIPAPIERTRVLAFVVDLAAALDGRKGIPPWEQLRDLVVEFEHHQEGLFDQSCLIEGASVFNRGSKRSI